MQTESILIINKLGLHARAASKFATEANKFAASVKVETKGKSIDGKSIMSIMLLAAAKGTELIITTEGKDEIDALAALKTLIRNRFDEGE